MKIMIVDDHPDMRRVLKNIVLLTITKPIEFIECDSGEDALGQYILHHPDCVLMDIELKGINGFQTVEKIYTQNPKADIIIVTSHNSISFRSKAKKLKVKGFVLKDKLSDITHVLESITST